jgi:DNA-binding MarR family transcriptional regulator
MVRVSLTPAGTRLIELLFPEFNGEETALTEHLDARQREALAGSLRSMLRAVDGTRV